MKPARLQFALAAASLAGLLSRRLLKRPGETLPGRILLALYPNALAELSRGRRIILVSGTNGKTSTTKALAKIVATLGEVATSPSGSNLTRGAAGILMQPHKLAVIEVDELHLPGVVKAVHPEIVLLLNLTRDQLHRMHEVKRVADRWHEMVKTNPTTLFIGDIDDPFINYALSSATRKRSISFGGRTHQDGAVCPQCGKYMNWNGVHYSSECGLTNNNADISLPAGSAAYRNNELAKIVAHEFGITDSEGSTELRELERRVVKQYGKVSASFRLTKNPASWVEALAGVEGNRVILILNAREVDGIDTSWLWDISYASLKGKEVVVTGERGIDLAYRLHVEGVTATLVENFESALAHFASGTVEVLAAYTAFHGLVM